MAHNDLHITVDHDRHKVTARREKHSISVRASISQADGLVMIDQLVETKVDMQPIVLPGSINSKNLPGKS